MKLQQNRRVKLWQTVDWVTSVQRRESPLNTGNVHQGGECDRWTSRTISYLGDLATSGQCGVLLSDRSRNLSVSGWILRPSSVFVECEVTDPKIGNVVQPLQGWRGSWQPLGTILQL